MSRRRPPPRPARGQARSARLVRLFVGGLWLALVVLAVVGLVGGWR